MALQARADSQTANSQNMASPRSEKLGVNLSTIRYLDESITSLHAKMDCLIEMMRLQMAQDQQLATQVAQLAAQSPRREQSLQPSHRRDPPSPAGEDDDFEMIRHHQLPRRDREMTSHREIKDRQTIFRSVRPGWPPAVCLPIQPPDSLCIRDQALLHSYQAKRRRLVQSNLS